MSVVFNQLKVGKALEMGKKFKVAFPGDQSFETLDNFAKGLGLDRKVDVKMPDRGI